MATHFVNICGFLHFWDQNGRHHEARLDKIVQNAIVKLDFRATATHFVNIFVFLYFSDFFYGFGGVQWAVMFW